MASSLTKSASVVPAHSYNASVNATKVEISAVPSNCYGFLVENNDESNAVYLQVFDKAAADVTVGTTVPDYTMKIPAGAVFGRDSQDIPFHFHSRGITIAVTTTRTNAVNPASSATVHVWHWNS